MTHFSFDRADAEGRLAEAETIRREAFRKMQAHDEWAALDEAERAPFQELLSTHLRQNQENVPVLINDLNELLGKVSEEERLVFEWEFVVKLQRILLGYYMALSDLHCYHRQMPKAAAMTTL